MLKLAIVGDPHFEIQSTGAKATWTHNLLKSDGSLVPGGPWGDLAALRSEENLQADILICVGDLGTKGDPDSLKAGWRHFNQLREDLGASLAVCTAGNHDLRTREDNNKLVANPVRHISESQGMFEALKMLEPTYPFTGPAMPLDQQSHLRTHFFGNYIAGHAGEGVRLIAFNSCGEYTSEPIAYERGSFPRSAQRALAEHLAGSDVAGLNILVCHHPPAQIGGGYDFIQRGGDLLDLLDGHGPWLVIHGHTHHGIIKYAAGAADNTPVVFSAASLGAAMKPEAGQPHAPPNQFYLVSAEVVGGRLMGWVRSWNWYSGSGWNEATPKQGGIYSGCGFGHRSAPDTLANRIVKDMAMTGSNRWDQMLLKFPELGHCVPEYLHRLDQSLFRLGYLVEVNPRTNVRESIAKRA